MRGEERWLQVNVALAVRGLAPLESARAVFHELRPLLRVWRSRGSLRSFFFMRKAPGVRLRFFGPEPSRRILPQLERRLSRLQRRKLIRRFFRSVYEPEIRLFGGALAMDLIHAYFAVDSGAWLELDRLAATGRGALSADVLALAVLNDLFVQALGDPGEVWDVWCNLGELRPALDGAAPRIGTPSLVDLRLLVTAAERPVLLRYARANQALARGLVRLWSRGALSGGLRSTLAYVATFHFNRHGLDASQQSRVIAAMMQAWSPRRRMRGADRA